MKQTLQVAELRQNLSEAVSQVEQQQQPIYITRFGKVTAKIVPVSAEEIEALENRQQNIMQFWGLWENRKETQNSVAYAQKLRDAASRRVGNPVQGKLK